MSLKVRLRNFKNYLRFPELRVFWLYLGLVAANFVLASFFLPAVWLLVSAGVLILLSAAVFASSMRTARSRHELEQEERRLKNIVNDLKDGVITYDQNFTILEFNPAAEQIFNLKASEVIGKTFTLESEQRSGYYASYKVLLTVLFPALAPAIRRRTEPGADVQMADLSLEDPPMELRVVTSKMYDGEGNVMGYVKIVRDRTRDLVLLRSKSEFITIASHQLRAPLTALSWAFETFRKESLSESQKELVAIGVRATDHLLRIVNDLLDVAKIEEGKFGYKFQELEIAPFLEDALRQAELVARQYKVEIYFERPREERLTVFADPERLGTAVSNIIDNAIKYNVPNGRVVVKAEQLRGEPYVQIGVRDTGVGIPPEVMSKLFTKFFRAENALRQITEGTGLGLFIARNVIRRHGGKVWAESELNRGSTFFFTLPTRQDLIPLKEVIYEEEI